jgi:hypothetical protein
MPSDPPVGGVVLTKITHEYEYLAAHCKWFCGLGVGQSGFKGDPQTVPLILDRPSPTWPNFTTNYTNRVGREGSRKTLLFHTSPRQLAALVPVT